MVRVRACVRARETEGDEGSRRGVLQVYIIVFGFTLPPVIY